MYIRGFHLYSNIFIRKPVERKYLYTDVYPEQCFHNEW